MDLSQAVEQANAFVFPGFLTDDDSLTQERSKNEEAIKVLTDAWKAAPLGREPFSFDLVRGLADRNRDICDRYGIERLRRTSRPGLVALAACAGQDISEVTADSLPFSIIPRLNAAGRMGTTDVAIDLLMTSDPAQAPVLAGQLEDINRQRREIESALTEEALAKVAATWHGGRVIVVGGEGWHEGVKGIVASRIVNRYHVPTILFTIQDGIARGSGRSVGSVDLFRAVEQCSDLLVRFGGHAGAVGVTCEASRLDEFRDRLESVLDALPAEEFESRGEVTAVVRLSELTVSSIASLEALQPFGQGNKKPLFAVRGVTMKNRSRVGADGAHLRFLATDGVSCVPAIMFRVPDCPRACATDSVVDLVFEAVDETWQGRTKPKLMVKDILYRDGGDEKPSGPSFVDELFAREEGAEGGAAAACSAAACAGWALKRLSRSAFITTHTLEKAHGRGADHRVQPQMERQVQKPRRDGDAHRVVKRKPRTGSP